ncbi:GNAT family N-acetyltransferase [Thalassospira sp. MA62]|nr:GNAT family N-acetyltransferase [Thalassospira sp. MA62]
MYLRPIDPVLDGPALHAIFGDPECCTWLPDPATPTPDQTIAHLQNWTAGFEDTSWVMARTPNGPALGHVSLYNSGRDPAIWEIACMVCPAARGENIATRALSRVIRHLFAATDARKVFADIDPDNHASIRTFEKLGFTYEGVLRAEWHTHIGIRDSVIFGLVRTDPQPAIKDELTLITKQTGAA